MGVPRQAKAFGLVSNELNLGVDLAQSRWLKRVLCAIKDENFAINAQRANNVRVLGLVARLVDFAWVLNLLHNVALDGRDVSRLAVSANFASILVVVIRVRRSSFWYLDIGNLQEIGAVIGSVRSQQQSVHAMVLALGLLHVGEPLYGESRPCQRGTVEVSKVKTAVCMRSTYPKIMSYKNGLFFFHVLYSLLALA